MAIEKARRYVPRIAILIAILVTAAGLILLKTLFEPDKPANNHPTVVRLGESLFYEPLLSEKNNTACATCHIPERSFSDGRRYSIGQTGKLMLRNTPTIMNRPGTGFQFWDGRALSLVELIVHPIETPDEMGRSIEEVCRRLAKAPRYRRMIRDAFGNIEITPRRVSVALASFLETLHSYNSDFDKQNELGTLLQEVAEGKKLFFGKARCSNCHLGQNFTDERFHNTGIAWKSDQDKGRGKLSGREEEIRAFKTPTLRELIRTAPYMHDGSLPTLERVIEHYAGGGAPADPHLDPLIVPVTFKPEEIKSLIAFLRSLSASSAPPFKTPEQFKRYLPPKNR
jgi:cytochrome c peroxidase